MPVEGTILKRDQKPRQLGPLRVQFSTGKLGDNAFVVTQAVTTGDIHVEFDGCPHVVYDAADMVKDAYRALVDEGLLEEEP